MVILSFAPATHFKEVGTGEQNTGKGVKCSQTSDQNILQAERLIGNKKGHPLQGKD